MPIFTTASLRAHIPTNRRRSWEYVPENFKNVIARSLRRNYLLCLRRLPHFVRNNCSTRREFSGTYIIIQNIL